MPSTNLYRKRKLSLKNYTAACFSLQNKCHEPRGISFLQGGKRILTCTFICSSLILSDMYKV